ncbi:MAG TPA: molybdate ABC transporter substrate-binding protein [Chromobacteriaceae bacterium]|nr:molybdate ABC transporter substrate-binding protein [Chromobacteriaceae bacterium]
MKSTSKVIAGFALLMASSFAAAGDVTVSAAASLTNAFKEIAQSFEAQHPGTNIHLNFGASGALLQQMSKGAPVDVFASADQETMDQAAKQGLIAPHSRHDFVRNALVLTVPSDSKLAIKTLKDLTQPGVTKIAIGNPASVPVGRYTQAALTAARLWPAINAKAIHTQNVRQSLDYVARGEVEAGFVYATDAAMMPGKVKVAFTVPLKEIIRYPIAESAHSSNAKEAKSFIDYVLSPAGQAVLGKYGFLKP